MTDTAAPSDAGRFRARLMLAIMLAGAALRLAYVNRPLDDRMRAPWRQSDYTQLARNYWREDANLFHPRIDWRRDGPGLVEMEFPLLPWTAGMLYRLFGYHEAILRALSAILEIGGLLLFAGLARRLLPQSGALAALAFYAFNPILIYLSTAMQPEPLMLFFSLLSVVLIERWGRTGSTATLLLAGGALGSAILAKAPAACLGFVFAFVILRRLGFAALKKTSVWVAAILAVAPPAAWYLWAERFWILYRNSLGLSNENLFLGLDMLHDPKWVFGLLKLETVGVLMPLGWILLLAARHAPHPATALPFAWLGSVWTFFIVSARLTSSDFCFYYHSIAVAPACLLMGAGVAALRDPGPTRVLRLGPGRLRQGVGTALAVGTIVLLVAATVVIIRGRDRHEDLRAMRACGLRFVTKIPMDGRIVVRGGKMYGRYGNPVAHDQSMLFAWLDRKGFTYGDQELSIPLLAGIAARGGRYWIAEAWELKGALRLEAVARFRLLAQCEPGYYLYDLQSAPMASPASADRGVHTK
jgi:4-amino-4-deoxy-L-arabinose transferase-like glycosyltransferase